MKRTRPSARNGAVLVENLNRSELEQDTEYGASEKTAQLQEFSMMSSLTGNSTAKII